MGRRRCYAEGQADTECGKDRDVAEGSGRDDAPAALALLAEGELSVKDFTEILGRASRDFAALLLVDARLIDRHAEGAWA